MELQNPRFKKYFIGFDQFIKNKELKSKSKMYHVQALEFMSWLEAKGITSMTKVTSGVMVDYHEYLTNRPKRSGSGVLSQSSINGHLYTIALLFEDLMESGVLNSIISLPKFNRDGVKNQRQIISMEQAKLLYEHSSSQRDRAIISAAYGCGLRRSEMEKLNVEDISFPTKMLIVVSGKNEKRREIPMSKRVIHYLKEYKYGERNNILSSVNQGQPAFFVANIGRRLTGDMMNKRLKEIIKTTGDEDMINKEISLHCLRHSIATHLMDNGAKMEFVQGFLGHSNIDTSHIYAIRRKRKFNQLISSTL
ncbi:MAG: tyrosine-type recombinase/integrase [Flavobacteriales bacterium]|nr:tyrosine-type recombinase/integrase [Flavobacteriales bacterium]